MFINRFSSFKGITSRCMYNSRHNRDLLFGIRKPFMRLPLRYTIRPVLVSALLGIIVVTLSIQPSTVYSQEQPTASSVMVEAIQLAKVRSGPGIDYPELGQIVTGTTYPLIGRNSHFPWYLIALPTTQGWVYADLVKVTGNLNSVPFSDAIIAVATAPAPTASLDSSTANSAGGSPAPGATLQPTATVQAFSGVTVEAISQTRGRYGPGTDFARVGTISKAQKYQVLRRHALYPWLEIEFDDIPRNHASPSTHTLPLLADFTLVPP